MDFGDGSSSGDTPLSLVMQFLHESGYSGALSALEEESGESFNYESFKFGGKLLSIIEEHNALKSFSEQPNDRDDNESLLVSGDGEYAKELIKTFSDIHKANILTLRFSHDTNNPLLATGSTEKTVKITNYKTGEEKFVSQAHTAPVLSLDFNPKDASLLLSSGMDGNVCLFNINSGLLLQRFSNHTKYAVRVKWSPDGNKFASASYDKTVRLYRKNDEGGPELFIFEKSFSFLGNPESIAFSLTSPQLIVAVREDNYIQFIDLESFEKTKLNMNENLDNHVSFSALDIVVSPDGKYLLVSTDKDRLILFKLGATAPSSSPSSSHVRRFYGASNDSFSQPRCAFSPSGKYVYSTSQDNKIYVWDVATQKILARLQGHSGVVRDIHIQQEENLLGSSSFDKTVKLWQ